MSRLPWPTKKIGELFDVQLGKMLNEKAKHGNLFPYLANFNVRWGAFDFSRLNEMAFSEKEQQKFSLHPGDMLMCEGGEIGRCAIWVGADRPIFYQKALHRLRPLSEHIKAEFIYYYMQYIASKGELPKLVGETSIAHLTREKLLCLRVPTPHLSEQIAITDLLSTWDAAIEKTERLIAAKGLQLEGLVSQLIVTPSRVNGNWKNLRIRDIAVRVQRKTNGGEYPILTISSASGFVLQKEKYSRYMAGESVKNYTLLRRGEFAYNKGNSLRYQFGCIFELNGYEEALVPHVYVCFELNENVVPSYLSHLFEADYLKQQLGAVVKTGIRNNGLLNIKPDEFMDVKVPIPPVEQQKSIAELLNTAWLEIDLLKKQAEAYRKQKRGLMQKLLTGEWRVKVEEVQTHG
jgi:type I restriction enzyme S subunit